MKRFSVAFAAWMILGQLAGAEDSRTGGSVTSASSLPFPVPASARNAAERRGGMHRLQIQHRTPKHQMSDQATSRDRSWVQAIRTLAQSVQMRPNSPLNRPTANRSPNLYNR